MVLRREGLPACLASMFGGLLISFVIHDSGSVPNIYSDITAFWGRGWVQSGSFPYVSEPFEYPPVSGIILYVARLIGGTQAGTYNAFGAMSFAAGGVLAWSTWSVARKIGRNLKPLYFMLPSFLVYGIYNFDLFHATFVMLSLQAFLGHRRASSAAALGLAAATKLASGVLLPVYLIQIRNRREALKFSAVFLAIIAVFNLPLMAVNFPNWFQTYSFIGNYGLEDAWFVWIFQNPSTWFYAKIFGFTLMGLLLLRVYTLKTDPTTMVFFALAAYLLGTYIYSPQFNLLLIPLLGVLAVENPSLYLWDSFNALIILTWFIGSGTPDWHPTLPWTYPQGFALLRAEALVWMAASVLRAKGWNLRSLLPRFFGQRTLDSSQVQLEPVRAAVPRSSGQHRC